MEVFAKIFALGGVAQRLEHAAHIRSAGGSIPSTATITTLFTSQLELNPKAYPFRDVCIGDEEKYERAFIY